MGSATENRRIHIYINGKQVENNMKSIRKEFYKTRNELESMDRSAKGYNQKIKDLQKLGGIMDQHRNKVRGVSMAYNRMKELALAVFGGNLLTAGITKLQQGISFLSRRVYELSDAQADVRKTTGLTAEEYDKLQKKLNKINTRTARMELLKLAEEGGRLGYRTVEEIEEFVRVADQLKVALGDDLGGESAIKDVGKLTQTFQVAKREGLGLEESLLSVGSAINELSASGSTQAGYLVDFTSRLSGAAVQAEIAETDIMGLAATLDEAGQKVEMSGTAVTQIILAMFKNTRAYAKIAKMDVEEFTDLLNVDANEALLKFLEGINGNNEGLKEMSTRFDALGIDGVRATSVVATLAKQTDKVREKQRLANDAFREASSLTKEFNLRNNNTAGILDKIQKRLVAAFLNPSVLKGIESMVMWLGKVTGALKPQSELLKDEIIELNRKRIKINDVNTSQGERIKLIRELQKQYPGYLGNLDAERVSVEDLNEAFKALNDQMVNRLIIARKQDKIDEQNQKIADKKEAFMDKEAKLTETLGEMMNKYKSFELDADKTTFENAQALNKLLADQAKKQSTTGIFNQQANDARELRQVIVDLALAQEDLNREEDVANQLLEEREDLRNRLGMNKKAADGGTLPTITITPDAVGGGGAAEAIQKNFVSKLKSSDKSIMIEGWSDFFAETLDEGMKDALKENQQKIYERLATFAELDYALANPWEQMKMDANGYYDYLLQLAEKHHYDTAEIERQRAETLEAIDRDMTIARAERYLQTAQMTKDLTNEIFGFVTQKQNAELAEFQALQERRAAVLDQRVERGVITERQAEFEKQQIAEETQKKEAEIQLKQWRMQKAQRVAQAFMDAAAMQLRIWADVPKVDFGISTGVLSGIAAGISATQIAAITAQKPPKFKFGGMITSGPSHDLGGMPLFDPNTGRVVAELEGNEAVLSRKFVKNNPEFTAAALNASKTGSRLNIPFLGSQPQPTKKMASGGYVPTSSGSNAGFNLNSSMDTTNLENEIKAMSSKLDGLKNIRAQISINELFDAENDYNTIQGLGDMG